MAPAAESRSQAAGTRVSSRSRTAWSRGHGPVPRRIRLLSRERVPRRGVARRAKKGGPGGRTGGGGGGWPVVKIKESEAWTDE
jgi:hypothetical protein